MKEDVNCDMRHPAVIVVGDWLRIRRNFDRSEREYERSLERWHLWSWMGVLVVFVRGFDNLKM